MRLVGKRVLITGTAGSQDESSWVTGQNYSIDGGVTAGFR